VEILNPKLILRVCVLTKLVCFVPFFKLAVLLIMGYVTVPIYDGRGVDGPPFDFSATDFYNIRNLPLYNHGADDLLPFSPVAIGYTVNTFPYSSQAREVGKGTLGLSPNVMFVILLGNRVE
jgi:hypothetical protein